MVPIAWHWACSHSKIDPDSLLRSPDSAGERFGVQSIGCLEPGTGPRSGCREYSQAVDAGCTTYLRLERLGRGEAKGMSVGNGITST